VFCAFGGGLQTTPPECSVTWIRTSPVAIGSRAPAPLLVGTWRYLNVRYAETYDVALCNRLWPVCSRCCLGNFKDRGLFRART
jgi:hypothetical protein